MNTDGYLIRGAEEIPSSERPGARHVVVTMSCCRDWPIVLGQPVKSCGLCGEVPEAKP